MKMQVVKIKLEKNDYEGDGKTWIARATKDGKIMDFLRGSFQGQKNRKGYAYKGTKIYELSDGYYIGNEPYSGKYSVRFFFEVKGKKVRVIWTKLRTKYGFCNEEREILPRCLAGLEVF